MINYDAMYLCAVEFLEVRPSGGLRFDTNMTREQAVTAASELKARGLIAMAIKMESVLPKRVVERFTIMVARDEELMADLLNQLRRDGAREPPEVTITALVN